MRGDKQQRIVRRDALGVAVDHAQRVLVVAELALIEIVILFGLDFVFILAPERDHRVERLDLGVVLIFGLIVVGRILGLRLLAALVHFHADWVADVVAVLLDKGFQAVLVQEIVVILVVGVVL